MPEFEEVSPEKNPQHNYVPSNDAKPRSRRRSGGFKKELSPATDSKIGEVDPSEILESESISESNQTNTPAETVDSIDPIIETETNTTDEIVATSLPTRSQHELKDFPVTTGKPSAETLAAIERVNARLIKRKADRDARYAARKKARDADDSATARDRRSHKKAAKKRGLLATIISIFSIGTKKPKSNRGMSRGRRPQNKGNSNSNKNRRRGGQNRGRQNYRKR
ncbi:MAG: hypothetical protein MK120_01400 [Puniceicoccaceae bacterium]|nr:hypothetical protein [Puniceicoccaceae bacterium]